MSTKKTRQTRSKKVASETPVKGLFSEPLLRSTPTTPVSEQKVVPEKIIEPPMAADLRPLRHRNVPRRIQERILPERLVGGADSDVQRIPQKRRHNFLEPKFKG